MACAAVVEVDSSALTVVVGLARLAKFARFAKVAKFARLVWLAAYRGLSSPPRNVLAFKAELTLATCKACIVPFP